MSDDPGLIAYADGSCLGNPGPGGWGVVLTGPAGAHLEFSGAADNTTNNRMEITAAIEALRRLPADSPVVIRSDSQYLVKTMTLGWKRRENLDLWAVLDALAASRRVRWEWVRGHSGDTLNERADELARSAAMGEPSSNDAIPQAAVSRRARSATGEAGSAPTSAKAALRTEPAAHNEDSPEAQVVRELRPLLAEGEALRRCAGCGRVFVASGELPPLLAYCALAQCQLKRRRARP